MTPLFLILGIFCGLAASQEESGPPCDGMSIEEMCKHTLAADFCGVTEECETKFWNAGPIKMTDENAGNSGVVTNFSSKDKSTGEPIYGISNEFSSKEKPIQKPLFGTLVFEASEASDTSGEDKIKQLLAVLKAREKESSSTPTSIASIN